MPKSLPKNVQYQRWNFSTLKITFTEYFWPYQHLYYSFQIHRACNASTEFRFHLFLFLFDRKIYRPWMFEVCNSEVKGLLIFGLILGEFVAVGSKCPITPELNLPWVCTYCDSRGLGWATSGSHTRIIHFTSTAPRGVPWTAKELVVRGSRYEPQIPRRLFQPLRFHPC